MIVISDALSLIQVRLGFVLFNNAEMIALPIALREAHRLQIDQLMAEGDSLCVIRWAS